MQFLYGDRELRIEIGDILTAEADVIVNPAKGDLTHNNGLAAHILAAAGDEMLTQTWLPIQFL